MNPNMTNKRMAQQTRDLATIKQAVAFAYEIFPSKLYAKTRKHEIVVPRQVAMYLCRVISGASYPDIAAAFAKKNHGTIMHACDVVKTSIATDKIFALRVNSIKGQIEGHLREEAAKQKIYAA